jgi:hypothetical protein
MPHLFGSNIIAQLCEKQGTRRITDKMRSDDEGVFFTGVFKVPHD